jgi:hypothetical protein
MRCETMPIKPMLIIHIFLAEAGRDYQNCEKMVKDFLHYISVMFALNGRLAGPA